MNNWHIFPLEIFPNGSISSSIITTVWIGIFVTTFFNLRFGWALSGFMVPGYLVPLAITKPWSAVAVVIESVFTYLLAIIIASLLSRTRGTSEFFGRDRFFLLLLISVFTRILFDEVVLPFGTNYINNTWNIGFDYHGEMHSFGLIIIALIANQFWKPGLIRGLFSLLVTFLATFFLIRYLLIPATNFSISNVGYMYEYTATSVAVGAKSYIILLTAAFIASRMNLLYSWEFNGILIPSLLALYWYEPTRILITFLEAFIIFFICKTTLNIPIFARMNIEGARRLLFFFNVSFIYKIILATSMQWFVPSITTKDYFAVGYLLSTLIAIKIYEKNIAVRMTYATMHTAFVSVVIASIIGFALTFITYPDANYDSQKKVAEVAVIPSEVAMEKENGTLEEWLFKYKPYIAAKDSNLYKKADTSALFFLDAEVLTPLYKVLLNLKKTNNFDNITDKQLSHIANNASLAGYRLINLKDKQTGREYLILAEKISSEMKYWGSYIFRIGNFAPYLIAAPQPLEYDGSIEYAALQFDSLNAGLLCLPGAHPMANNTDEANVLSPKNKYTLFNLVNQVWIRENSDSPLHIIHIMSYTYLRGMNSVVEGVLFAPAYGIRNSGPLKNLQERLLTLHSSLGTYLRIVDGSLATIGYEVPKSPQFDYSQVIPNKDFSVLWLPKTSIKKQMENKEYILQNPQFAILNIPTNIASIKDVIASYPTLSADWHMDLVEEVQFYLERKDIILLESILRQWPEFKIEHILDQYSDQSFLVITDKQENLLLVANLNPVDSQSIIHITSENNGMTVSNFIKHRKALLLGGAV